MSSSTRATRTGVKSATRTGVKPATRPAAKPATRTRRKTPAISARPLATVVGATPSEPMPSAVTEELRHTWVAEAAYYIAERRGFSGGSPEDDWCQAEVQIAQLLAGPGH